MTIWTVPAIVVRVIDGDTIKLDLDLGWHIKHMGVNCRIFGFDAPELITDAGKAAKGYAMGILEIGQEVTFRSHSLDKYGRPLGELFFGAGRDFAAAMIFAGHGVPYSGGKRT